MQNAWLFEWLIEHHLMWVVWLLIGMAAIIMAMNKIGRQINKNRKSEEMSKK